MAFSPHSASQRYSTFGCASFPSHFNVFLSITYYMYMCIYFHAYVHTQDYSTSISPELWLYYGYIYILVNKNV